MGQVDDYVVSVAQNTLVDLAQGRSWQTGAYVARIGVYAPAAATNGEYGFTGDDMEVFPRGTQPVGTAPSATPALEHKKVDVTADKNWKLPFLHAGAAAQNIRVQIEYDQLIEEAEAEA